MSARQTLKTHSMVSFEFNTLVLSGGGARGVLQLGALQELHVSWRDSLRTVVGSSVGGLIGLLLILGYEPSEIDQRFLTPQVLSHFRRERIVWSDAIKQLSLFSWSVLEDVLRFACMEKLHYVPTLSELLTSTGKSLVVTTWNLTKQRIEYLSAESRPDMCVLQALRMTSAIWFVFPRVMYDNCQYLDGSVGDHTPWRYLVVNGEACVSNHDEPKTLVLDLPSPTAPTGSTLIQLLLSAVHVNQNFSEMMAMSLLKPSNTCWVSLNSGAEEKLETALTVSPEEHVLKWNEGRQQARAVYGEFKEDNERVWVEQQQVQKRARHAVSSTELRVRRLSKNHSEECVEGEE